MSSFTATLYNPILRAVFYLQHCKVRSLPICEKTNKTKDQQTEFSIGLPSHLQIFRITTNHTLFIEAFTEGFAIQLQHFYFPSYFVISIVIRIWFNNKLTTAENKRLHKFFINCIYTTSKYQKANNNTNNMIINFRNSINWKNNTMYFVKFSLHTFV